MQLLVMVHFVEIANIEGDPSYGVYCTNERMLVWGTDEQARLFWWQNIQETGGDENGSRPWVASIVLLSTSEEQEYQHEDTEDDIMKREK